MLLQTMPARRLPYVAAMKSGGRLYLYYRRHGRLQPLTGPEGCAVFLSDYDRIHATFDQPPAPWNNHTLGHAIADYLASADFQNLAPGTRFNYERELAGVTARAGGVYIEHIDIPWMERLRDAYADRPYRWNSLRSRMLAVFDRYRRLHPGKLPINPWRDVRRLSQPQSDQNRAWPDDVVLAVLRAATPEFRALLVTLLLTAQRIGDVCSLEATQYDAAKLILRHQQKKTGKWQMLHVPPPLALAFAAMKRRHPTRLLVSPRGKAWNPINAEETLLVLRTNLALPRYTLHGLRATGPTALKVLGFENRPIREITGHDSDRNLEIYLRGAGGFPMAKVAQDALAERFSEVMVQSTVGANNRRYSGVTGRAARALAPILPAEPGRPDLKAQVATVNRLQIVKREAG